jgi:hypothetical protein
LGSLVNRFPRPLLVAGRILALAPLFACAACGPSDRPTGAETGSEIASDDVAPTSADDAEAIGEPGIPTRTCTPGAVGECRLFYMDDHGTHHCSLSYQHCALDGSAWLPCGGSLPSE